uniref:V-SNARE coiled-coil homology domain-containing protein n=1 Tax=Davidia involucrata TaxID=16924 RepID=A0A5B7B8W9_DAVIN
MFAKRLIQKATHHHLHHHPQHNVNGGMTSADLDLRLTIHYGIPSTASILAFDPIQGLLAIGTLDGRIKVIGGDNIEGLLISPMQLPYKYLEFLQNQGFIVSISNDNDIQVWNLESRCIACSLQWESNITAFSVICGSRFMYVGDEYGLLSVLKYEAEDGELLQLPYQISMNSLTEAAGFSCPNHQPIVGVLPQPHSSGNRVLITYESGLIILWDVVEGRIVVVRGDKLLQLKDGIVDSPSEMDTSPDDTSEQHLEEKEISALCWASSNGSILAVGYIDGDILFWKISSSASSKDQQAGLSCNGVVKLQLSSAERRLPVIVLHWRANDKSHNDGDGQLFIYGGDEIGSEEVLTVLSLEWSSGVESLRCVGRVDLTLTGSFADMILLQTAGARGSNHDAALFVLTNPGQLHFLDNDSLYGLVSQQEKKISATAVEFPVVIPTVDPLMTVAKLSSLPTGGNSSKALSEITSVVKVGSTPTLAGGTKWPLTGGVSNHMSFAEDNMVERVYVAGYQDGSVRIWDATHPVISLLCVLEGEVKDIKVAGSSASVSKLDFCCLTLSLAVGNECGLVHLYNLNGSLDDTSFHFVTETKHEVHNLPQGTGPNCRAVFSLLNSPVQMLQFANCGAKLAVGYECGRVVVLDMSSLSVLFLTDSVSGPSSPVISMTWKAFMHRNGSVKSPKQSGSNIPDNPVEELMFILTRGAKVHVIDGGTGNMISSRPMHLKKQSTAISMYVIEGNITVSELVNEKQPQELSKDAIASNEPSQNITPSGINQHETEPHSSSENAQSGESLKDSLVLLCCKDALRLYHTKSVVQGDNKPICKVKLAKPCCWTTTFKKDKVCGLVLLYQTGAVEIRSLPDLELVKETSLMSILRWNFKANMDRTMSSTDNGHITLANGCELAFISLLASENDFRIPESLPCLHDKVLAAAAVAAISISSNQKKKKGTAPKILGGIVKGFKGGKVNRTMDLAATYKSNVSHLDGVFSRDPFPESSPTTTNNQEAVELNIDDIDIDEPLSVASTSSRKVQHNEREKGTEREKLFDGEGADAKPRLRTREEIIATYRKAGDASSVAGQARNKLLERQEKLERISRQTEELQSGAEDFASLANELVKAMEGRKWWQI